jgi:K+-transporting ATPase ATPase C chain
VPRPSTAALPASGGSDQGERDTDHVAGRRTEVARREGVAEERVPQDTAG